MRNDPYQQIIDLLIACGLYQEGGSDQQGAPVLPLPAQIAEAVNAGLSQLAGVPDYSAVATTKVAMRNDVLRAGLNTFQASQQTYNELQDARTALLEQRVEQLAAGLSATSAEVRATTARLELVSAARVATQAQLDANTAADALIVARLVAVEQQQAADRLADAALAAHEAKQDADIALLSARAGSDEALIAAAQAAATAAQVRADQAVNAAATAQSTATAAGTAASTAQAAATAAQQAAATNATAVAAVAADVATRLPAASVQRFIVNTPPLTVAVGQPATFNVVLPKPFATNQYLVFFTKASGSALLNVQLSDTAKLPGSFTGTMQQTGLASLAAGASSAEVLAILIS
jgi:hypothetical protein